MSTADIETEDIFPNDNRLTLKEQERVTSYIAEKVQTNAYPTYLSTLHEYEPVFWYHLKSFGISYVDAINPEALYKEGNYFFIQYPKDSTRSMDKSFTLVEKKTFGVLVVYTLEPKVENICAVRQSPESYSTLEQTTQIQELKTWNDLLK
jgi:hypothetical protein